MIKPVTLNTINSTKRKPGLLDTWWNSVSYSNKLSREVFRMNNFLGHATWSLYSSTTKGNSKSRTNVTITNDGTISTSYNYGNLSFTVENTGMSYKMFGSLLEIGVSTDGFNSRIGTSSFGIESTYKPSSGVTFLGAVAAITLSGQFELYPTLVPLIAK